MNDDDISCQRNTLPITYTTTGDGDGRSSIVGDASTTHIFIHTQDCVIGLFRSGVTLILHKYPLYLLWFTITLLWFRGDNIVIMYQPVPNNKFHYILLSRICIMKNVNKKTFEFLTTSTTTTTTPPWRDHPQSTHLKYIDRVSDNPKRVVEFHSP